MGLDSEWKAEFKSRYEEAWLSSIPPSERDFWHIEDLMNFCRKIPECTKPSLDAKDEDHAERRKPPITTGIQIFDRIVDKINYIIYTYPSVRGVVFSFDEAEHNPPNKINLQTQRDKKNTAEPYSAEYVKKHNVHISDGILPDMFRFMATRHLRDDLYRYLTEKFMTGKWNILVPRRPPQFTVIILGARFQCFDNCHRTGNVTEDGDVEMEDGEMMDHLVTQEDKVFSSCCTLYKKRFYDVVDMDPCVHYTRPANVMIEMRGDAFNARETPSYEIGETDLKVITVINSYILSASRNPIVCIKSVDCDNLLICLLNMRRWITKKGFLFKLYLDLTVRKNTEIVDMNLLWMKIMQMFRQLLPEIRAPIEVYTILILLCGCDYTRGFSGIGPRTIWTCFTYQHSGGHNFFQYDDVFRISETNDPESPYEITIGEAYIVDFIAYVLTWKARNGPPDKFHNFMTFPQLANRIKHKRMDTSEFETSDIVLSEVRRLSWTINYWYNGSFGKKYPIFSKDPTTGHSMYGWIKDRVMLTTDGKYYEQIKLAEKVFQTKRSPADSRHQQQQQQQLVVPRLQLMPGRKYP